MVVPIALDSPVFVPYIKTLDLGAGPVTEAAIDPLTKEKISGIDVRKREMRHVQFGKERRVVFDVFLTIAHAEAKECYLITEALTAFRLKMAGIVPPFGPEIRMGKVIGRKRQGPSGESELICESGRHQKNADECRDRCRKPAVVETIFHDLQSPFD